MSGSAVAVIGAGIGPFGRFEECSLKALSAPVIEEALSDAALERRDIEMAFVANAVASLMTGQASVVGQVVLAHAGFHGIPVYNVDNACAGSSSALNLAVMAVRSGAARTVLVVGVEKLFDSNRAKTYRALNAAADLEWAESTDADLGRESIFIKKVYPARLAAYKAKWGLQAETLAKIAVKNRRHAGLNPLAQYRAPLDVEQVLAARMVVEPLTTLMCAPIGDGASAVVVSAEENGRASRSPVWIRASAVSMGSPPGNHETTVHRVADLAYRQAGIGPDAIDVAEVHDATAFTELLAYEELRLCEPGRAAEAVDQADFALGGRVPVNTSGGLESRGHPMAATGLAQVVELVRQLRGEAGERQVNGARNALAETAGGYVGGDSAAVAVHVLSQDPGSS